MFLHQDLRIKSQVKLLVRHSMYIAYCITCLPDMQVAIIGECIKQILSADERDKMYIKSDEDNIMFSKYINIQ